MSNEIRINKHLKKDNTLLERNENRRFNGTTIAVLPDEVLTMVFQYLSLIDVRIVKCTSSKYRDVIINNSCEKTAFLLAIKPKCFEMEYRIFIHSGKRFCQSALFSMEEILIFFREFKKDNLMFFLSLSRFERCEELTLSTKNRIKTVFSFKLNSTSIIATDSCVFNLLGQSLLFREKWRKFIIYDRGLDGKWKCGATIERDHYISQNEFSLLGRDVLIGGKKEFSIYGKDADSGWKKQLEIVSSGDIDFLKFDYFGSRVFHCSNNEINVYAKQANGEWNHKGKILIPDFDKFRSKIHFTKSGIHILLLNKGMCFTTIYSEGTNGIWGDETVITHGFIIGDVIFNKQQNRVLSYDNMGNIKIFRECSVSKWEEEIVIKKIGLNCPISTNVFCSKFDDSGDRVLFVFCKTALIYKMCDNIWVVKGVLTHGYSYGSDLSGAFDLSGTMVAILDSHSSMVFCENNSGAWVNESTQLKFDYITNCCKFSPTDSLIVYFIGKKLHFYNKDSNSTCSHTQSFEYKIGIENVKFSPSGDYVVIGFDDNSLHVYRKGFNKWFLALKSESSNLPIKRFLFSPSETCFLHYRGKEVKIYTQSVNRNWINNLTIKHEKDVCDLKLSLSGRQMITCTSDCSVNIFALDKDGWALKKASRFTGIPTVKLTNFGTCFMICSADICELMEIQSENDESFLSVGYV